MRLLACSLAIAAVLASGCDDTSTVTPPPGSGGQGGAGGEGGAGGAGGQGGGGGGSDIQIETSHGPVTGVAVGEAEVFYAIPYAAPPVGALRWKPPQDPAPWTEPIDGSAPGPVCPQLDALSGNPIQSASEDCLTLNVWRPSDAADLPVMVWIHGGAFRLGSGHGGGMHAGERLTQEDVVVVTVNYRLGPLGFLAHSDLTAEDGGYASSGNYGIEDQRHALRWVEENIAAFGGDPDNVTIFGESAGSISTCIHLASGPSAGLFDRVVMQSGPCDGIRLLADAEDQGTAFASALGCESNTLTCLRDQDVDALLTALPPDSSIIFDQNNWAPNVDGLNLSEQPTASFAAGNFNAVPVLAGTVRDEGTLFVALGGLQNMTEPQYEAAVTQFGNAYGIDPAPVLAEYPASDYPTPAAAFATLVSEVGFQCPTRRFVRAMAAQSNPAYLYHWVYEPDFDFLGDLGAFHSADVAYVFGTPILGLVDLTPEEAPLVDTMTGYWSAFARTGDPADGGGPSWPAYAEASDEHLEIDLGTVAVDSGLRKDKCDFWDTQLPQ